MKYTNKKKFKEKNYFGTGIRNVFLLKNMTDKSYLKPLKMIKNQMMLANVSFAPKSRCFWHIHRATTEEDKS